MVMTQYALPDLRYDYGALEPHISGKILELHHDKHHGAYVKGANDTLEQLDEARHKGDLSRLAFLERALAFNLSGHILHSIFWQNLVPKGGGRPDGELAAAIERDFGGFDQLKRQMVQAASTIMGSGWAALVWEPVGRRLLTTQIYDHQSNLSRGESRSWCWMHGSTPSTCSIKTGRQSFLRRCGTSGTGPMPQRDSEP